jgi:hypothetical protein
MRLATNSRSDAPSAALTRRSPPAPLPGPSDRLRELAAHVLRLGQRGWSNPETFTLAKHTIAGEMKALAWELER